MTCIPSLWKIKVSCTQYFRARFEKANHIHMGSSFRSLKKKVQNQLINLLGLACPTWMQFLTCTITWNLKKQNISPTFKLQTTNGLDESIRSKLTNLNGIEKLLKRVDIVASYAPVSVFPMSYDFLKFWEANWDMQDFIHTYYNFH